MATGDFFRARLDQMIDLRHPLAVLAQRLPWPQIEVSIAPLFAHKALAGRLVCDAVCSATTWRSPLPARATRGPRACRCG